MVKYVALALLVISACKKDEKKAPPAPKAEPDDKGAKPGGSGKGDGTGGGKGDGTGGGGGKGDGACPALSITVDGVALEGLTHGRAVTMINGEYTIQMVNLYNREVPCADALAGQWAGAEGDIYAKAWFSDMSGVGIDAYTEMPLQPKITVAKETKTVGEPFELCVADPIAFTPNAGAYADKKVVMQGLFVGEWCGEAKQ